MNLRRTAEAAAILVVLPVAAQLTLSWIGFNPTDDGFILAGARRILGGQVPHRDFISIRPAGSFIVHVPEVLLGGARVFLVSRAVFWFEIAVGAWCWVLLIEALRRRAFDPVLRGSVAAFVFALNAHIFPAMAWHSVDGATLTAAGLALAARGFPIAGYAVLGLGPLCRQNLLPMIPAGIVLLGDWRRPGCWAAAFLPSAIYAAGISALGGWRDMVIQLGARTDLVEPGILAYARLRETWVGVAAGAAAAGLAAARGPLSRAGVAVAGAVAFAGAAGLWGGSIQAGPGFLLWGSAVAIAVVLGLRRDPAARAAWLAAAAGWCVSVSFGYNTPALLAGALAAVPLSLALGSMEKTRPRAALVLGVSLAFLALAAMWHARPRHVYRDNPAITLDCDLGSVLPGGEGIRTNSNTAAFLRSLGQTVKRCGNRPYAVVPDCAAWWVRAPSPNPLPADWLSNTEISRPELFMRVVKSLDAGRNGRYVILQKWRADSIEWARRPMRGQADYAIADVVRRAMRKVGDAGEFEVFN